MNSKKLRLKTSFLDSKQWLGFFFSCALTIGVEYKTKEKNARGEKTTHLKTSRASRFISRPRTLIEGSEFAVNSCVRLRGIQCYFNQMTLDAQKIVTLKLTARGMSNRSAREDSFPL